LTAIRQAEHVKALILYAKLNAQMDAWFEEQIASLQSSFSNMERDFLDIVVKRSSGEGQISSEGTEESGSNNEVEVEQAH